MEDTAASTGHPVPQAQGMALLLMELGEDTPQKHVLQTDGLDGVTPSKEGVPQPTPPSAA